MIMTGLYSTNLLPILSLQLLLFIILFGYSFRHIKSQFKRPSRLSIAAMSFIVIILAGFCDFNIGKTTTLTVAKEFSFGEYQFYYPTEAYGIESAEHGLVDRGAVKYILSDTVYPWGPVYPFLISIPFFLFGHNPIFITALDIVMIALLVPTLFFLMFLITKDEKLSILTTLFFPIIMIFIYFRCNQFLEIYFFFFTLTLLLMLVSYRLNRPETYALASLSILFTMEIHFESLVMLPAFFIGILLFRNRNFRNRKSFFNLMYKMRFALILFLLLSPIYFIKVASVKTYLYQHLIITTPSDSLYEDIFGMLYSFQDPQINEDHLPYFPSQFIWFWSQEIMFPMALLAILGACTKIKKNRREISLLMFIFIMHTFTYLHIGNGYQTVYADRTIIPILVISGLGIGTVVNYLNRHLRFPQWAPAIIMIFLIINSANFFEAPFNLLHEGEYETYYNKGLEVLADDTNIGTIVVNSESIENNMEFLTLHDAFNIQSLLYEMFSFPEIQFFYQGGGLDFNKSLEEDKIKRQKEQLKYLFEYIEGNSSYMRKLSNIILDDGRNNYYIREPKTAGLFDEMESDFIKRNFRMEMLSDTSGIVIYKLSR